METLALFTISKTCFTAYRVKFGTGSSMSQKVNSGAEWRRIPKSVVAAHVEVLEELARVEYSHLYALDTMLLHHRTDFLSSLVIDLLIFDLEM